MSKLQVIDIETAAHNVAKAVIEKIFSDCDEITSNYDYSSFKKIIQDATVTYADAYDFAYEQLQEQNNLAESATED